MAEILRTPEQAKEAAHRIVEQQAEQTAAKKFGFEQFMNALGEASPETGGFDEIGALLALPDEPFTILAPIFLAELERGLRNTNDQMILVQSMNMAGLKIE
jgi:hypothetical protein